MRGLLQAIDQIGGADARRLRAALAAHQLDEIERGEGTWHPVGLLVTWIETVDRTLGRRRLESLFGAFARIETQGSILKSFVSGALRMFGPGGSTLARRIPGGMSLMYRDLGQVSDMQVSASEHLITIEDLAEVCAASPSYVPAVAAYYQGLFDALGVRGTVSITEHDRAQRRVVFRCVWS